MATRPMTQDMEEEGDTRLERSFSALESKQNFPFAKCKHCIYTWSSWKSRSRIVIVEKGLCSVTLP